MMQATPILTKQQDFRIFAQWQKKPTLHRIFT